MARSHFLKFYLVRVTVLVLLSLSLAENTCQKKGCTKNGSTGKLAFSPGSVYDYSFESIMTLSVETGAHNDDNTMKMTGTAKLFAEGDCSYILHLGSLKVVTSKETIEKKITSNLLKPVHFTMTNDILDPEICIDSNENINTLNIKRAIISMIQSATETDYEYDIFGQCPTTSALINADGGALVVTKMRNLNRCRFRENYSSILYNGLLNKQAGLTSFQATNIINADWYKESRIVDGILESAKVTEEYHLGTSLKSNSGVYSKIVTTLKLKNKASRNGSKSAPAIGTKKASIIFQKPVAESTSNIVALKKSLENLIKLTEEYVHKTSAVDFLELIRLMRNSDYKTLIELMNVPYPNKVQARKVYLDALFRTRTTESAKAILKQVGKMSKDEKRLAIMSLNLIEYIDKETLTLTMELMNKDAPKEIFLSIASLISKYCKFHQCDALKEVETVAKRFQDNLNRCKPESKRDEDRIIYVLRGLSNSKNLVENSIPSLLDCSDVNRPNRIRVAAIQAFGAHSCHSEIRKKCMSLLSNRNEDSEVRIEAYIALINCPSAEVANFIADLVNTESVKQVGGYIASNLKAIRDSTDPHRELQKHFFGNIRVNQRFTPDFRRYSFNNEFSYKFPSLGLSASLDHRLIYSQSGFLPRSGQLNLTTEILGSNINVLDVKVRQENFEQVLEYLIGPKGILNKNMDEIMKIIESERIENDNKHSNVKRSIADEAVKVSKKYKSYAYARAVNDINLDLSFKLFGSELVFLSLGDNIPQTFHELIHLFINNVKTLKKELGTFDKTFTMHSFFLDTQLIYPTASGVPMDLSSQGIAASKIEIGTSLNVDAIMQQNWQDANQKLQIKLIPSFDIVLFLKSGFNFMGIGAGLKLTSNLHSATGSDIKFQIVNEGQGFDFDLELPRKKLELIDIDMGMTFYVNEPDKLSKSLSIKEVKPSKSSYPSPLCFNQLEMLGINICLQYEDDKSLDGKIGNSVIDQAISSLKYSVYITSERYINVHASHISLTDKGSQLWKLEYKTPKSEKSHNTELTFEFAINSPQSYSRMVFTNPNFKFALEAGLQNNENELALYGQMEQDQTVSKSKVGLKKNGNEYSPLIEINENQRIVDNIAGYKIDGKITVSENPSNTETKFQFQHLRIFNIDSPDNTITLSGWATIGSIFFETDSEIQLPGQINYHFNTGFHVDNGKYNAKLFLNNKNHPENIIGASVKVGYEQNKLDVNMSGKGFQWDLAAQTNVDYKKSDDSNYLSAIDFKNFLLLKHQKKDIMKLSMTGSFEGYDKIHLLADFHKAPNTGSLAIDFERNQKTQLDYYAKINGKFNKHFAEISSKLDFNGNHYITDNTLTTSCGTTISFKGEIGQRYTLQDVYIDLKGSTQFSSKEKPHKWLLKSLGAPEKTSTEMKIYKDANLEYMKLSLELMHPQDKISSIKGMMNIKSLMQSKVDYKIAKNGKGELNAVLELLEGPTKPHKLEVASKFHLLAPKYDMDLTVKHDDKQIVYVKSENVIDKYKTSTMNLIDFEGKKVTFNGNLNQKGDWKLNGETIGSFKIILPNSEVLQAALNRKLTTNSKTGITHGSVELKLEDNKKRSLGLALKLDKFNVKSKEMISNWHLTFSDALNKNINFDVNMKFIPQSAEKYSSIDLGVDISSSYIKNPVKVQLLISEFSKSHVNAQVIFKIDDVLFAINMICQLPRIDSTNDESIPNLESFKILGRFDSFLQMKVELSAPTSQWKKFEMNFNGRMHKETHESDDKYIIELNFDERHGNSHFIINKNEIILANHVKTLSISLESSEMTQPLKLQISTENHFDNISKETLGLHSISNPSNWIGNSKYSVAINFADQFIKGEGEVEITDAFTIHIICDLKSSFESYKTVQLKIDGSKLETEAETSLKIDLKTGEDNHNAILIKLFNNEHKKGLKLTIQMPNIKPILIHSVGEAIGNKKVKFLINIQNLLDLDLTGEAESAFTALDNFFINAKYHSNKLQLNQYEFSARTDKNTLQISLKNALNVIFDGSIKISIKEESNKAIIDGQGQLQFKDKAEKATFRFIRQTYSAATDQNNEVGFSYTLTGNLGSKSFESNYKLTNRELNMQFLSSCPNKDKKNCIQMHIQSVLDYQTKLQDSVNDDLTNFIHSANILVDLREVGYPYEFKFNSKNTNSNGLKYHISLSMSLHSKDNIKYILKMSMLPTGSTLQLQLPNREIAIESITHVPQWGELLGKYENSIKIYTDKSKNPQNVLYCAAKLDISAQHNSRLNIKAALQVTHPLVRQLQIFGAVQADLENQSLLTDLEFDVFKLKEQKLVLKSNINAKGSSLEKYAFNITMATNIFGSSFDVNYDISSNLGLDFKEKLFTTSTSIESPTNSKMKNKFFVFIFTDSNNAVTKLESGLYILNDEIFHTENEFSKKTDNQIYKLKSNLKLWSEEYPWLIDSTATLKSFDLLMKIGNDLVLRGNIESGKELQLQLSGHNNPVFDTTLALDSEHFLQSKITSSDEGLKKLWLSTEENIKEKYKITAKKINEVFETMKEIAAKHGELIKIGLPDIKPLIGLYEKDVEQLVIELGEDPHLKQFAGILKHIYEDISKVIYDLDVLSKESIESIRSSWENVLENLNQIAKQTIIPSLNEMTLSLNSILKNLQIWTFEILKFTFNFSADMVKKYGPLVGQYLKTFYDSISPLLESLGAYMKTMLISYEELIIDLESYLAALPSLDGLLSNFKSKIETWKLDEQFVGLLDNIFEKLTILPTNIETTEFLEKIHKYLVMKVKSFKTTQPVENEKQLVKDLLKSLIKAIRTIFTYVDEHTGELQFWSTAPFSTSTTAQIFSKDTFNSIFSLIESIIEIISTVPELLQFRSSFLNYLWNENWKYIDISHLWSSWKLFSDFSMQGHLIDGQHLMSFDGNYLRLPHTNCKYILTQDIVDNNFTLIATLNNGKLKSIILTDGDNSFVEVTDNGLLKANGKSSEYPYHEKGLHLWRNYYTIHLLSEYGIHVMCTSELKVCHIHINGFYTSKVRGLLGNGNAEPFDDFMHMDGHIDADANSFINNYAMGKCAPAAFSPNQRSDSNELCSEMFGYSSPLALGYYFKNPKPFRQACNEALAGASEKDFEALACTIALGYGSALKMENQAILLPPRCLKCTGPSAPNLGQELTVKIPTNKADLVFVIDFDISETQMTTIVGPLLKDIRETLKARGLTDIQIAVLAYSENQKYPALLTSDGGKLNWNGDIKDVKLKGPTKIDLNLEDFGDNIKVSEFVESVKKIMQLVQPQSDELAYKFAFEYPFRAAAAKSIIAIRHNILDSNNLLKSVRAQVVGGLRSYDSTLLHLIGPIDDLSVEGLSSEKIIGFNSRLIATIEGKDNKKRQKLQFANNLGIDFVLNNNGWVFNSRNFDKFKAQEQKKTVTQISTSIADSLFKTEITSDCTCVPVHGLHAQHLCLTKTLTFVPNKKPKTS